MRYALLCSAVIDLTVPSCIRIDAPSTESIGVLTCLLAATSACRRAYRLANDKGVDFSTLVNNLLRKDIDLIGIAK